MRASRVILLQGDFGTGKTLLSVALGYHMLAERWVNQCAFNFPVSFGGAPGKYRTYTVIDEGGRLFDNRMAFKDKDLNRLSAEMTWNLRKTGSYVLMPSYLDVDRRFRRGLRIHRQFPVGDLLRPNLLEKHVWVYWWERGEEELELRREGVNYWSGKLLFLNPPAFFGSYDTYYQPSWELLQDFVRRIV